MERRFLKEHTKLVLGGELHFEVEQLLPRELGVGLQLFKPQVFIER